MVRDKLDPGGRVAEVAVCVGERPSPAHRDGKLWPMTTQRPEAIAAAKKSLGPAVMQVLERPGASVAELLSTLYP